MEGTYLNHTPSMSPAGSQSPSLHDTESQGCPAPSRAKQSCLGHCSPCCRGRGKLLCRAILQGQSCQQKRKREMFPRFCCSLRDKVMPLLSLSGFVSTAIESLMITFSPTWSYFSSCSAASPWQLRTPSDTSPLGTKYAYHTPSLAVY